MLRFCLLLVWVYGAASQQAQDCAGLSSKDLADIVETKEKVEAMIESLTNHIKGGAPSPTVPATYSNCQQIRDAGHTEDGYYQILVPGFPLLMSVFCDMTTDGGGWMVFQDRFNGSEYFNNRTYAEYTRGFGEPYGEFWIGNDLISTITKSGPTELRIEMSDWEDNEVYAKYSRFVVEVADRNYRLTLGEYNGTAGDSLSYHNGAQFSAYDVDNDKSSSHNCAQRHHGGWWFNNCMRSNLNGQYIQGGAHESYAEGVAWSRFNGLKYSLKSTQMKMRPVI